MNEEYIKEYENMNLYDFADELVEPLSTVKQNLTKTIYIHYAKERDEKEQLQNNWNELKKWLKSIGLTGVVLKMQELEQGKDE